jgi:hypothetical protein
MSHNLDTYSKLLLDIYNYVVLEDDFYKDRIDECQLRWAGDDTWIQMVTPLYTLIITVQDHLWFDRPKPDKKDVEELFGFISDCNYADMYGDDEDDDIFCPDYVMENLIDTLGNYGIYATNASVLTIYNMLCDLKVSLRESCYA